MAQLISFDQQRQNIAAHEEVINLLNPYFLIDPEMDAKNAQFYITLWTVANYAAYVFFGAVALAVNIFLGMKAPALIPLSLTSVYEGFEYSLPFATNYTKEKLREPIVEREVAMGTLQKIHELEQMDLRSYRIELYLNCPGWNNDVAIHSEILSKVDTVTERAFIPLLARHKFWKEHAAKAHIAAREILDKAANIAREIDTTPTLTPEEKAKKAREIVALRKKHYYLIEKEALPAKINAAFFLSIMKNPLNLPQITSEERIPVDLSYFGRYETLNMSERMLLRLYEQNEEEKDPYFIKSDGHKVSRDWIDTHSYFAIAREIYNY